MLVFNGPRGGRKKSKKEYSLVFREIKEKNVVIFCQYKRGLISYCAGIADLYFLVCLKILLNLSV